MTYDLIIISQSKGNLIQVTQNCIDSARKDNADLNIIVVETGNPYKYDVDKIIEYNGEFNYNHALNLGLKHAKGDVQILANNDLIFHKGWSKMGDIMRVNGYLSASALSQDDRQRFFRHGEFAYEGYNVGYQLTGWCIFTSKKLWSIIGDLDETHQFWFSDNVYAEQLKAKGIKHALICSVQVDHLGSQTLKMQPRSIQSQYTYSQGRNTRDFKNLINANNQRTGQAHTKALPKKV
jgi:hypothetical protein